MDEKAKEEMMKKWKELGLDKDMVDEHVMWGAKKIMFGIAKVKHSLKEKGMEEAKVKEVLKKMLDMAIESDMKMDWKEKHGMHGWHGKEKEEE